MDGEHLFSAAIILVMVNIAFPQNSRDYAAMKLALEVMKGVAEKGNSHIKSLYQLLLNLSIPTERESPDETVLGVTRQNTMPTPHSVPLEGPSPNILSHNDLNACGYIDLTAAIY